ncbi:hypothetical protein ACGFWI_37700 [Streptomyces sp. NPDC048434]|uniref:hypothetical protein n=1 Tax=Streptomyces sp. NPDC048434 TaxID=3365549 RepID=UPI00371BDB6D
MFSSRFQVLIASEARSRAIGVPASACRGSRIADLGGQFDELVEAHVQPVGSMQALGKTVVVLGLVVAIGEDLGADGRFVVSRGQGHADEVAVDTEGSPTAGEGARG